MHLFIRSEKFVALMLLGGAFAFGQQVPPSTPAQSAPNQIPAAAPATGLSNRSGVSLPANNRLAQPAFLTPIYGLQGVLAETVDGTTVAAQSVDEKFNPASAINCAATLVAVRPVGPPSLVIISV